MWNTLPQFGTVVLCAMLVAAGYTLSVSIAATAGRPRLLQSARSGAYATVALVALAVLVLAYAFLSHDFRLDYVSRYSDRTMSPAWLVAALWGGQDGSILWWLFLTAFFSGACVWWLKGRYRELQPVIIATLMVILIFLAILMLFSANPFRTLVSGAPPDGQGLNYQLRNFYMIIHPPSLYIGFTSAAIPFAFAIAALVTGRLDNEWIIASRKWMLFCWLFLTIGNALGMLWAYEELGWGGYWAWDPVENASFLPWLTASAYVHSVMIQERRGMLKMWNVVLICITFLLTYFGTFLTRSGLIASVHSFARSGIGVFFLWFMLLIIVVSVGLIWYRANELRARGGMDSILSREFTFVVNNWALLFMMLFIAVATVWPRISEWLWDQKATIGPPFYNTFIPPIGLLLIFLMGTAPLLGWRKTSKELFYKSFRWPVGAMVVTIVLHIALGKRFGFPAFIEVEPIYAGIVGSLLAWFKGQGPVITTALVVYNLTVVAQEVWRGVVGRRKTREESIPLALFRLVSKSRRRYGGYLVHVGVAVMFLGFAGRAWEVKKEVSLEVGQSVTIEEYNLTYKGPRTEADHEKRMSFADLEVLRNGEPVGIISPGRNVYRASPNQPSTEVDRHQTLRNDLYISLGGLDPRGGVATFRIHINPLVFFVWFGISLMIIGAMVSMWPEASLQQAGAFRYVRAMGSAAVMIMLSIVLALMPSKAYGAQAPPEPNAQGPPAQQAQGKGQATPHEVHPDKVIELSREERSLFQQLLCNCGDCPKEPIETCTCGWAHNARNTARMELQQGKSVETIVAAYAEKNGPDTIIVQATTGANRAIWLVPLAIGLAGVALIWQLGKRWSSAASPSDEEGMGSKRRDDYDDKLDAELDDLD